MKSTRGRKKTEKKLKRPFSGSTKSADEIRRFDALGHEWWDEDGPMKPLHALTPARMTYLRDTIAAHFGLPPDSRTPLKGLSIADIGCGAGLAAEPLCRMGAAVTGIDAGEENIRVAKAHAEKSGLDINYRCAAAEDLAREGVRFDVVTALEVIEHVSDPALFVSACCALVKPGGIIIFSTINRTAKSYALAIVGAEYLLRWLEPGTHDWKKFMKPSEIAKLLEEESFAATDVTGLTYNPLTRAFSLGKKDLAVNYFLAGARR